MPEQRPKIPEDLAARILAANRHLCCVCHTEGRQVQIHHIDEDPSNNNPHNLCVLCLQHHSEVTAGGGLGRSYSEKELKIYKQQWEEHCSFESQKQTVINNFMIISRDVPALQNQDVAWRFFRDVSSGVTPAAVNASIDSTGSMVEYLTKGSFTAKQFVEAIRKEKDKQSSK